MRRHWRWTALVLLSLVAHAEMPSDARIQPAADAWFAKKRSATR